MLVLLITILCFINAYAEDWSRHLVLDTDGKYHLWWRRDKDSIVFQVEVATTGWIGFGISPNGGMSGSDMVIAWISNGNTTFHDRHAMGNFMPIMDEQQDWKLLWSNENDTHTLIRFQRELNTCDKEDLPITEQTARLIYAYNKDDPSSADSVMYHGPTKRGSKSTYLLQEGHDDRDLGDPEDLVHWDIRAANIEIPHDTDTSYLCTVVKRKPLDSLHHILKIEAIVQPGHERFLHHMVLNECTDAKENETEPLLEGYHQCYTEDQYPNFAFCFKSIAFWAVGGEPMYMPDEVGLPFGRPSGVYYVLEIHYDNPGFEKGIVDNSGLRLTYTPKLRKHDSGVFVIGSLWYDCMFIPPRQKEFMVSGHSHPACLRQGIPPGGIKVFSVLLHSHLAGKKIRVRHFRDRVELPTIAVDDTYDFNYQNVIMLPEEHEVLPNDHMITECTYDTSSRNKSTFAGLSTHEEMCVVFLLYYPEMPLTVSTSCPIAINRVKELGVTQMSDDHKFLVSPISGRNESYIDFLNSYPWDENSVSAVQKAMKYDPQTNACIEKGGKFKLVSDLSTYPKVSKVYEEPDICAIRRSEANRQQFEEPYSESENSNPQILPHHILEQVERE